MALLPYGELSESRVLPSSPHSWSSSCSIAMSSKGRVQVSGNGSPSCARRGGASRIAEIKGRFAWAQLPSGRVARLPALASDYFRCPLSIRRTGRVVSLGRRADAVGLVALGLTDTALAQPPAG